MPKTIQDRFIAVLDECEAMWKAFEAVKLEIGQSLDIYGGDSEMSKSDLVAVLKVILHGHNRPYMENTMIERRHFTTNGKRNIRERQRQSQKRLEGLMAPRQPKQPTLTPPKQNYYPGMLPPGVEIDGDMPDDTGLINPFTKDKP